MAEIVYDSTSCPNPEVVLVEALNSMAVSTKAAICQSLADSKSYTDAQVAAINSQLEALDSQDTLTKINTLKALVETLDLDTDGSIVDNLLDIKDLADNAKTAADAAQAAATAAQGAASQAVADALACSQALASFQISVSTSLANLDARVSTLESQVGGFDSRISTVEDSISQIQSSIANLSGGGTNEEEVRTIAQEEICKNNVRFAAGLSAAVAAWSATMAGACPLPNNN